VQKTRNWGKPLSGPRTNEANGGASGKDGIGVIPQPGSGAGASELLLAEAALEPQQQSVIALAGFVDAVLVDEQRVHDAADLDELVPLPVVAGEAGHLARRHGTTVAQTDLGDPALPGRTRVPLALRPRASSTTSTSCHPSA